MSHAPLRLEVGSRLAAWILGLALGVPAAIIFLVQLPLMNGGSEEAATNVTISAVLLGIAGVIFTARHRVTIDTAARTVTWSRSLFGLTWRRKTVPAERFVALAVERVSGQVHTRTVRLVDRDGKRALVKDPAGTHEQTELEMRAIALGWSIER